MGGGEDRRRRARSTGIALALGFALTVVFVAWRAGKHEPRIERARSAVPVAGVQVAPAAHELEPVPSVPQSREPEAPRAVARSADLDLPGSVQLREELLAAGRMLQAAEPPPPTATIHGTVRIANAPLGEAALATVETLDFEPRDGFLAHGSAGGLAWRLPGQRRVAVGYDGTFELSGLPLGSWRMRCTAMNTVTVERVVELKFAGERSEQLFELVSVRAFHVVLVDEAGRTLDERTDPHLATQIASLRVFLTDRAPTVGAAFPPPGIVSSRASPVAGGMDGLRARITTQFVGPTWCSVAFDRSVAGVSAVPEGAASVSVSVSRDLLYGARSALHVSVLEAGVRRGLPNARVRLTWPGGRTETLGGDRSGTITAANLSPADVRVRVEADGFLAEERGLSLLAGEVNRLAIELTPAIDLSGICVDAAGRPRSAKVHAIWVRDERETSGRTFETQADAAGRFHFDALPRGRYLVRRAPSGTIRDASQRVDCRSGSATGVVLVVEGG